MLSNIEGIREELREIKAVLTTIASALTKEIEERPRHRRPRPDARLLSQREAAHRLGVDRNTTLVDLIRTGQIRTVEVNGKRKVPASEVERLAQEGFDTSQPEPKRRAPRARGASARKPGDAIRALKL
jgi:excisionase family DNA binding protein